MGTMRKHTKGEGSHNEGGVAGGGTENDLKSPKKPKHAEIETKLFYIKLNAGKKGHSFWIAVWWLLGAIVYQIDMTVQLFKLDRYMSDTMNFLCIKVAYFLGGVLFTLGLCNHFF